MKTSTHREAFIGVVMCFLLGIIMERYFHFPIQWLWISVIVSLGIVFSPYRLSTTIGLCLLLMSAGAMRTHHEFQLPADDLVHVAKYYRSKPIRLRGWVNSDVEYRQFNHTMKTVFTLNVLEYQAPWGWKSQTGKVLVGYFGNQKVNYGNHIEIEGKLHKPFEFGKSSTFSYQNYLEQRGIYRLLSVKKSTEVIILDDDYGQKWIKQIYQLREKMRNVLRDHLSFNEYGLMQAILLGDRSYIPKHVMMLFERTGTVHIIAISGMNMTVIAGIFLILARILPVGRRAHYLLTIVLLFLYMVLVDGRPSVIRATIMAIVFLLSFLIEREGKPLNTLAVAAFILLLINPFYLFDIGFQLSFICVLSIFLVWPVVDLVLKPIGFFSTKLGQMISFSLAVWIGSAPLIVYYFNLFIPINLLANLWVVPIFTVILILGLGLIFSGLVIPVLAAHFALCLKVVLNLMVAGVFIVEKIPGAYFIINNVNIWYIITYYIIICLIIYINNKYFKHTTEGGSLIDKAKQLW